MNNHEQGEDNNEFSGTKTIPGDKTNGLLPHSSSMEFRQFSSSQSFLKQDNSAPTSHIMQLSIVENDSKNRPPSSSLGGLMKRRNSNLANCEKMLQEMTDPANDIYRRERDESEAILECAGGICNTEDELDSKRLTTTTKEEALAIESYNPDDQSEGDGQAKPEDPNQALLQYFAQLSSSGSVDDSLDWEHIQSLLHRGASVNTTDRFGQSLLHEVSRTWGVEVAQFFIEQGADVNKADDYGRTSLHVAASADYPEMVRFLIENGGDIHVATKGELQTPLHFAARNEASQCVKILLAYGATLEVRDYKQRTPLQLAAETNSAECARILMEAGASAGTRDDSGMSALALMVTKMPSVALRALDQFHITDRSHRKQRYYLNFLEYCDPPDTKNRSVLTSPLQTVVEMNCFELVMHPIFQRLIEIKWKFFGVRAWVGIFLNVLLTVSYTVLGITHPNDIMNYYSPLKENFWRILLDALVVFLTFNEIRKEVKEFYQSRRENKKFISWRKKEVRRDLEYSHPRWTQERTFIKQHVREIKERKRFYFQDRWNYFDWLTYLMLIIVIILHVINVVVQNNNYNDVFIRILACSIIFVWIRLLKFARPFPTQGPFVVILDNILGDTFRWAFVIAMFYIPYAVAFWMLFGERSKHPVKGYDKPYHLIYTVIRYPLVDNYGFDALEAKAPIMARVLCGSFLILTAIVLMNLYIALLSNTFQRVYDNARATAAMQRVRLLQDLEQDASDKTVKRYREHIRTKCSPEGSDYHVIISDEEDQNRKQKEKIALVHTIVSDRLGGKKFGRVQKSEFDIVLEDIELLKRSQNEVQKSLDRLHVRLEEIGSLNAITYEEITKVMQNSKEQMSSIDIVNKDVANLKDNIEEKFQGLATGVDLKFGTLETESKVRSSALESNLNERFDQMEVKIEDAGTSYYKLVDEIRERLSEITERMSEHERFSKFEQEMTARIEGLESYVVSLEEDKIKGKRERKPSPRPRKKSSVARSQTVEGKVRSLNEAAGQVLSDGSTLSNLSMDERHSAEKQRERTITLSGQAARDEYIARLKESHTKSVEGEKSNEN